MIHKTRCFVCVVTNDRFVCYSAFYSQFSSLYKHLVLLVFLSLFFLLSFFFIRSSFISFSFTLHHQYVALLLFFLFVSVFFFVFVVIVTISYCVFISVQTNRFNWCECVCVWCARAFYFTIFLFSYFGSLKMKNKTKWTIRKDDQLHIITERFKHATAFICTFKRCAAIVVMFFLPRTHSLQFILSVFILFVLISFHLQNACTYDR